MAKNTIVLSHWYQLIEDFQTSSLAFYEALEVALQKRAVPETKNSRVDFKEGGLMTAKREYLHIVRGKHVFDICAAPYGNGFFFSWWLTELTSPYRFFYLMGFLFVVGFLFSLFFLFGYLTGGFFFGAIVAFFATPAACWMFGRSTRDGANDLEEKILVTPILGPLYERVFNPPTYYVVDTAFMFQEAVHNAVLEVVDQVTREKGVRALSELERKPVLKAFAQSA